MKVNGASEDVGANGPGTFTLLVLVDFTVDFSGEARLPVGAYLHIKPVVAGVSQPSV